MQFEGIVYKQIFGVPMDTNYVPHKTDFCYERDFMTNLHQFKQYDLMHMLTEPLEILTRYIIHH